MYLFNQTANSWLFAGLLVSPSGVRRFGQTLRSHDGMVLVGVPGTATVPGAVRVYAERQGKLGLGKSCFRYYLPGD